MRILTLVLSLLAAPLAAHEYWLEPQDFQLPADGRLVADIVNGQDFDGNKLAYIPQRFAHFITLLGDRAVSVPGRVGDRPALQMDSLGEGLHVVAYQAKNATISYENWAKFQRFVEHKAFGDILTRHQARGLPMENFKEVYARYSKTLIGVGNSAGSDRRTGLETEIVALTNPYTDPLTNGMQLQLFYGNTVRANAQIEVFEKSPTDAVTVAFYTTNSQGIAAVAVKPGYTYMADAVVLREPSAALATETGAVWETLWANLTWGVPE